MMVPQSAATENVTRPKSCALGSLPPSREEELLDFIVHQLLPAGYNDVDLDTPLLEWGVIDSILIQSLLRFMEERYHILIPAEAVRPEDFGTIRKMAAVVDRCVAEHTLAEKTEPLEMLNRLLESYGLERHWMEFSTGRHHVLRCAGKKPGLVLLSGLGTPASSWGLILRSLAGKREAMALDLAGFGVSESGTNGDFSFPVHVRNTIAIMERVMNGPSILVGNSAGAMILAEVARQRPELCAGLIVISFGRVRDGNLWWKELQRISKDPDDFWKRAFYNPPPLDSALREQIRSTLSSRAYLEFLDPHTTANMDGTFEGLTLPTMFIGGENDGIIEPKIVKDGAEQVKGARLEWVPRCGHFAQSERSEEMLVYIEHFVKGLKIAE